MLLESSGFFVDTCFRYFILEFESLGVFVYYFLVGCMRGLIVSSFCLLD